MSASSGNPKPSVCKLKVLRHAQGRYTLMQKSPGDAHFSDLKGPLFGNCNEAQFYRAVARHVAELARQGHIVSFRDCA